jgi:hypothetical protein
MSVPPSREELDSVIASALAQYDDDVRAEWDRIHVEPQKWRCSPWGDEAGGFWAVAVDDDQVLWFNDIEEGFNWSRYTSHGTIDEYLCNQTEFIEILEQIAQRNGERARAQLREAGVPPEIAGPGTIEVRQTTYWDIRSKSGLRYRIHLRDKVEFAFSDAAYPSIELIDRHPLLVQYDAPYRSLYFSGAPQRPRSIAEMIDRSIRADSESWRGLGDYAGNIEAVERLLRAGHGMLMTAPEPVCAVAVRVLEADGVLCSVLGNARPHPGKRLVLLGASYVIAGGFAFENRGPS